MTARIAGAPPAASAAPARDGAGRLTAELRAARMVWWREILHFVRDRTGAIVSLTQPLLFLFILGVGLARLFAGSGGGSAADYLMFLFPGVLVMAAQPPAMSVGASIVWDRQSGFLREMLVSPVRRSTLLAGKCLGGATVATAQGLVVLAGAGLIHIPYRPALFVPLVGELALTALAMTVLGAVLAVTIERMRTFTTVLGMLMTPLIFLSGLMFPVSAMPGWMRVLTLANPLTYAVDAMRRTVVTHRRGRPPAALFEPVAWGGGHPPVLLELGVVAAFTLVALIVAARRFSR